MKKLNIAIILSIFSACLFPININAEAPNSQFSTDDITEMEFHFKDFTYTTSDISSDTYIVYELDDSKETYYVYENGTNILVDKITVDYGQNDYTIAPAMNPNAHDAFFTRDKTISGNNIGLVTIRFTASVKYYSSGSFRSFEGLNYTNLSIASSVCHSRLENSSHSATPSGGKYPTTQLDFTYVTNIVSSTDVNTTLGSAFLSAGFTLSDNYYKYVSSSGSFNLY